MIAVFISDDEKGIEKSYYYSSETPQEFKEEELSNGLVLGFFSPLDTKQLYQVAPKIFIACYINGSSLTYTINIDTEGYKLVGTIQFRFYSDHVIEIAEYEKTTESADHYKNETVKSCCLATLSNDELKTPDLTDFEFYQR